MGREGAILFAAAGAHVVVVDIRPDAGAEVVDQIAGGGGSAESHVVDMTDLDQIERLVSDVGKKHGRIDVCGTTPVPRGRAGSSSTATCGTSRSTSTFVRRCF